MAIKKEPIVLPYVCHYRLNRNCEKQKSSLSPRCIPLLSERSTVTVLPSSKSFGHNGISIYSQPVVEPLILTTTPTTETNLKKYGLQSGLRLPELTFSPAEPTPKQSLHLQCKTSRSCGSNQKSSRNGGFGLQVISCQPAIKDNIVEDQDVLQPKRKQIKSLRQKIPTPKQNETEYLQVVSSPPRIKKIMSSNVPKIDRVKTLHDHLLCERFSNHMANHLQRSKSEIVQKSYSTHAMQQNLSEGRPLSSAAAIKSGSMKSPKSQKRLNYLKTSNSGIGSTPPTSPEVHAESNGSLKQNGLNNQSVGTDFPKTSAVGESSFSLAVPKLDLLDREKHSLTSDESKTVANSTDRDQKYLQGVKDRLNLSPGEKKRRKEKRKAISENKAKDVSALSERQDSKSGFHQATVNKQETIPDTEQRNVLFASNSNFEMEISLNQYSDMSQAKKETSQDNQLNISEDGSSYSSRQVSKKEKKPGHISFQTLKEPKSGDHHETGRIFNPNPNPEADPDQKEKEDKDKINKVGVNQVNLGKPKLPSSTQKLKNLKRESLMQKLAARNRPDIQNLLKPLPRHGHKQYFDPQEMAEKRRQKLLEKMNQKKLLLDNASPTGQTLFEDYGWLAKYCIFNKENWKIYGRTFETADTKNKGWLTPQETMMALRTANNQLTPSEEEYLCRIIEMTGYRIEEGSDLRLFSILAALSHRITSLDNWMKSVLDNMDYGLLDMKTFKTKTLWECNVDPETNKISLEQLCVELRVGGVSLAHEQEVKDRLQHLKALDLLDFLTYIPLFIMIHESVVDNPLDFSRKK